VREVTIPVHCPDGEVGSAGWETEGELCRRCRDAAVRHVFLLISSAFR